MPCSAGDDLPEIDTHFQPIVHLRDGELFGFEALARSSALAPGESPAILFARAQRQGRLWELDTSCRRMAATRFAERAQGLFLLPRVHLFLNAHPLSLADPGHRPGLTRRWVQQAGLQPSQVVLELTETVALDQVAYLERALGYYRDEGFQIALDDMGAGHSALASIFTLRPDFIKIDRSLVTGVDRDRARQHLVRGLAEACRAASIQVVAEGIERPQELDALRALGVELGQGFFLGRPARLPRAVTRRALSHIGRRAASSGTGIEGSGSPPPGPRRCSAPPGAWPGTHPTHG
ncbi:EAL domain-containing protein [Limnochorda pilosa]|uniref:Diguanylate phosphodiesterase n=1 Tax=Limnochorda pilosa TaxID=1555112 RepID=A0A0K2SJ84_LIMPI|nr:EAL domain-containing protein [Limnochorda pilosa]BAS27176.1 diguanylate phosphodiesterase [Limnochorda pilosa]